MIVEMFLFDGQRDEKTVEPGGIKIWNFRVKQQHLWSLVGLTLYVTWYAESDRAYAVLVALSLPSLTSWLT